MKNIAKPKLLSIPIHMPPCHVQNRIAEQLMAMDRLRDQYAHQLERIEVLFASLQQRAFMGQL